MLAQEAGTYCERPVALSLRKHFACVWINRLSETLATPFTVVPDGTIDLQWIAGRWRIAGPDRRPQKESMPAGSVIIGFRFQPGSASTWLGAAASEFCNERVWLEDVPGGADLLTPDVLEVRRREPRVRDLENVLTQRATSMRLAEPDMQFAYRLLSVGPPSGADVVPWIMSALDLSERTLRRRFQVAFGYGPKTLERILRFQRYLQILRNPTPTSAAIRAAAAGYADQSHLVRECRRLALCTPSQLPSALTARPTQA
jgi:AraC-like DNA-binding protein